MESTGVRDESDNLSPQEYGWMSRESHVYPDMHVFVAKHL